ncbi:MAG: acyl-CoA dehydrogenase family protein [Planctomycetes bacterium]|nr:acyl-CoA dehydrogenase family protein [Planctomycetota bacterium]
MTTDREKQIAEAEEMLEGRLDREGFANGLYFGQYLDETLPPYPEIAADDEVGELIEKVRRFCRDEIDPVAIDREAKIPQSVIDGLGRLNVLGACLPTSCGGLGLGQVDYCRIMEVLGGHCGSTALFVNAHHSIGPRALVLFGSEEQQARWLPKLATGESLSAFALTEPEAGSDAANVQTMATPEADGSGYRLNGEKRWITNGSIAEVLTVMARTPVDEGDETKVTAFIVTPDMPGFKVVEARMDKCGVRGTVTSRLAFENMFVPTENVLGELGKGLKVALTVLDFGRTTFGASCTGAAKFCRDRAVERATSRIQFGEPIGSFEMVKEKLAYMAAGTFAMEAATFQTAALIDSDSSEFMLETAMLKVFSTEVLWRIVNDTFQIYGGKAYFTDEPYERLMRDARINTIGEGANDVLRAFVGLVGMRGVGLELKGVWEAIQNPLANLAKLGSFATQRIERLFTTPEVKVQSQHLDPEAARLGRLIARFGRNVERLLRTYREDIVERQYQLQRAADSATELYVSTCVIQRLDRLLQDARPDEIAEPLAAGRYYLKTAHRRVLRNLRMMWSNDDAETTALADMMMAEASPARSAARPNTGRRRRR